MTNIFFVKSTEMNPKELTFEGILIALREKIDLKVPVSAFIHIGLNGCIEHENN